MDRDELMETIIAMLETYDDEYLEQILETITATLH